MKTATVTWITYNNYGTLLQAYALQRQIEQLGHENMILSDKDILKAYNAAKTDAVSPAPSVSDATPPVSWFARIRELAFHPGRLRRSLLAHTDAEKYAAPYEDSQRISEAFKREELHILYDVGPDDLADINESFDAFIAGSDQVWSVFDSIFNPYYYLDFATKRKISYAPSLGTDKILPATAERIRAMLADYAAVSVRESISARQLSEITGREVAWVADPTLLHDRTFWSAFAGAGRLRQKPYLLCYFLENRAWYFAYARKLAKQLRLDIVLLPNKWDFLSSEYVTDFGVGPREFVSLIRDAAYVLTDSYHGSIFSLLFEKSFQYLQRFSADDPNSQNIRIESLFGYLELGDRVVEGDGGMVPDNQMNRSVAQSRIRAFRERSIRFLENGLS